MYMAALEAMQSPLPGEEPLPPVTSFAQQVQQWWWFPPAVLCRRKNEGFDTLKSLR